MPRKPRHALTITRHLDCVGQQDACKTSVETIHESPRLSEQPQILLNEACVMDRAGAKQSAAQKRAYVADLLLA